MKGQSRYLQGNQGGPCSFGPLPSASCFPPSISLARPGPACYSSHREAHNLPGLEGARSLYALVFEVNGFTLMAPFSPRSIEHTHCRLLLLLCGVSEKHGFLPHLTIVEPLRNSHSSPGIWGQSWNKSLLSNHSHSGQDMAGLSGRLGCPKQDWEVRKLGLLPLDFSKLCSSFSTPLGRILRTNSTQGVKYYFP